MAKTETSSCLQRAMDGAYALAYEHRDNMDVEYVLASILSQECARGTKAINAYPRSGVLSKKGKTQSEVFLADFVLKKLRNPHRFFRRRRQSQIKPTRATEMVMEMARRIAFANNDPSVSSEHFILAIFHHHERALPRNRSRAWQALTQAGITLEALELAVQMLSGDQEVWPTTQCRL